MKTVIRKSVSAAIMILGMVLSIQTAHAASPGAQVAKLNWDGFQTCKAQGSSGWTAVARGILGNSGGEGGRYFQIRHCFSTQAKCDVFLNRIHHNIHSIEQLNYARCSPRG